MIIHFKVIIESNENSWVGWFGENVIKVKLVTKKAEAKQNLLKFINENLGIKFEDMEVMKEDNLISIEFPDQAWELFWSIIEK